MAAARTLPFRLVRSDRGCSLRLRVGSKQLANQSKALGTVPVGKESKLANAYEAVWENMLHVAPQKLRCRECHESLLVSVCIVLPAESDFFPIKRNEPVIADGNAMGIAAQIAKYRFWARHGLFDIDDPVFLTQRLHKGPECLGIFEWPGCAAETEPIPAIRTLESVEKLAAEDLTSVHRAEGKNDTVALPNDSGRVKVRRRVRDSGDVGGAIVTHNTLSADVTHVQVFYPFHPLHGYSLRVLRKPKKGDGAVVVRDAVGKRLKIPMWMLYPEAARAEIARDAYLDSDSLLSLAVLLHGATGEDRGNLLQTSAGDRKGDQHAATATAKPGSNRRRSHGRRGSGQRRSARSHGAHSGDSVSSRGKGER